MSTFESFFITESFFQIAKHVIMLGDSLKWKSVFHIAGYCNTMSQATPVTFKNDVAQQPEWLTFKVQ